MSTMTEAEVDGHSVGLFFEVESIDDAERDYLNGAHDRNNLEYRQRQIDHGLFRHAYKM